MWIVPAVHSHLQASFSALNVGLILENVVMRSKEFEDHISSALHIKPVLTKAEDKCPCARSRLIWFNIATGPPDSEIISWSNCVASGWIPAFVRNDPDGRFGAFLRPFPPGRPSEYPAPFARLPLSAYDQYGLVVKMDLDQDIRSTVYDHLDRVKSSTGDSKDPSSSSYSCRRDLCEFIHLQNGSQYIRPLSASERLLCLGFRSVQAPDHSHDMLSSLQHLSVTGNTFAVPVFRDLLSKLVADVGSAVPVHIDRLCLNLFDRRSSLLALGSKEQVNRSR